MVWLSICVCLPYVQVRLVCGSGLSVALYACVILCVCVRCVSRCVCKCV